MNLWKKRLQEAIEEITKYGKYLLNDHAGIFLFFLSIGGAVMYQKWLFSLPSTFPWALVVCLFLALIMNHQPFFSLLKKGDIAFLTPREGTSEMRQYIQRAQILSIIFQLFVLFVCFFVCVPLILYFTDYTKGEWLQIVLILILLKLWTFYLYQVRARLLFMQKPVAGFISFFSFIGSFTLLYCTFMFGFYEIVWGLLFIVFGITLFFLLIQCTNVFPWQYWIEKEESRWGFFYRLASQVTTVPNLPIKIRKRAYARFLLSEKRNTDQEQFQYEFSRSWLRMGDYFPIFLRLLFVFFVVVYYFQLHIGAWVLGLIFLLLYGLQLLPMYQIHQHDLWEQVLPLDGTIRKQAFIHFIQGRLFLFSGCMSGGILIFTFHWWSFVGGLVLFLLLSILFSKFYIANKI